MSHVTTHRYVRTAAAVGGLTAAVVVMTVTPTSGAPAAAATKLRFDAKLTSYHQQPAKPHGGPRAGEAIEFSDKLFRGKTQVGHDFGSGTYIDPNHISLSWTVVVVGGSLQMAGVGRPTNAPYHLAIVGGTGKYAGASGTMTVTDANNAVAHYVLTLT